jgi:hypothetical protein
MAYIFKEEKSVSRWLQINHQSKTPSSITTGREGEWAIWEINRKERGRICRDQVGRPGEHVAEGGRCLVYANILSVAQATLCSFKQ